MDVSQKLVGWSGHIITMESTLKTNSGFHSQDWKHLFVPVGTNQSSVFQGSEGEIGQNVREYLEMEWNFKSQMHNIDIVNILVLNMHTN